MKNWVVKFLLVFVCSFSLLSIVNAESLKDLKDKLAKDEANMANLIKKEKEVQDKIKSMNNQIDELTKKIKEYEKQIEETKEKINKLNEDIKSKKEEIDNLLSFLQISDGNNVYLDYVFQASSYTDFIYRNSVVEQLTKYNDELIDQMYKMIDENKKLQKDLNDKINKSESTIDSLNELLKQYGLDMSDIDEQQKSVEEKIKIRKMEIQGFEETYKANNCKETIDVQDCLGVPYADGFTRPLKKGTITSDYGMRFHPTQGYYKSHNGIDIGGNSTGTPVYASASGRVTSLVRRSSCGGNMVYIQHTVDGKKYRSVYMHLNSIKVSVGQIVTIGTVIGTVGGGEYYDYCSTGPHLHFAIMKGWSGYSYYNPRNYVNFPRENGKFYSRF